MTREQANAAAVPSAGMSRRGWHRLAEYATCPRRFAYKFLFKLEPARVSEPLALGSLVHIGLMHYYLGRIGSEHARDPIEAMRTAPERIAYQFDRARMIFDGYRSFYAAEKIRVLDVEREFVVKADGHEHTQRADLVVEQQGHACIFDHKVQGNIAASALREHEVSGQFTGYQTIGEALLPNLYGLPFGGVWVNALRSQPPFGAVDSFRRLPLLPPRERVRAFPVIVRDVNLAIAADASAHRDPWDYRPNPGACRGRYGWCEYRSLCDRGKPALHSGEFVHAVDAASDVREGSGT